MHCRVLTIIPSRCERRRCKPKYHQNLVIKVGENHCQLCLSLPSTHPNRPPNLSSTVINCQPPLPLLFFIIAITTLIQTVFITTIIPTFRHCYKTSDCPKDYACNSDGQCKLKIGCDINDRHPESLQILTKIMLWPMRHRDALNSQPNGDL